MRRWQTWLGFSLILLFCGCGGAVLFPVFASARVAARISEEMMSIRKFRMAIIEYCDQHHGRLPAKDWRKSILAVDPSLAHLLQSREEGWSYGLAVVPGMLGQRLEALPDEKIVFVGYRSQDGIDILKHTGDIGADHRPGSAIALTTAQIFSGGSFPPYQSAARIGYRLAVQGATDLD